jgi:hypothetical protein
VDGAFAVSLWALCCHFWRPITQSSRLLLRNCRTTSQLERFLQIPFPSRPEEGRTALEVAEKGLTNVESHSLTDLCSSVSKCAAGFTPEQIVRIS